MTGTLRHKNNGSQLTGPEAKADRYHLLSAQTMKTPIGEMLAVTSSTHLHMLGFEDGRGTQSEFTKLKKASRREIQHTHATPLGEQLQQELDAYFRGASAKFTVPLDYLGTEFSCRVWEELTRIPAGETRSYSEIAQRIGRPKAVRAVARANGANMFTILVPCHRVIGADGSLTGFGGGLWRKKRLLEHECIWAKA